MTTSDALHRARRYLETPKCGNCGGILNAGKPHQYYLLGSCIIPEGDPSDQDVDLRSILNALVDELEASLEANEQLRSRLHHR